MHQGLQSELLLTTISEPESGHLPYARKPLRFALRLTCAGHFNVRLKEETR
jgi:hypothetical protein